MNTATQYLVKHGSISEADYPYTAGNGYAGYCKQSGKKIAATVSGYTSLPYGNEGETTLVTFYSAYCWTVEKEQPNINFA